jgi:hypothetical protein
MTAIMGPHNHTKIFTTDSLVGSMFITKIVTAKKIFAENASTRGLSPKMQFQAKTSLVL